ncbi:ABC transporter ATP-binding protein [Pseudoxanthomonas sp. PXM02]|uniref:ABC transporter ATP-binding protein n=1 Tax=Pseudoxanthomonas sp. PXM02 TaxID=2769294 RepID=UPI001783906A|nr:ABC transporter ATP-binding protein [Pseudoxanthomonas sp. PXM02]MBD9477888.1 ABC transporter ATP-binding protein [Pseudoxanthomonas sp. PXM02]
MTQDAWLELDGVAVGYPGPDGWRTVVQGLSLALPRGEIGALLGASGCGKTTALRAIAGFEPITGGRIVLDGIELAGQHHALAPEQRRVGMMFQDYALFPHLDVAGNIAFGIHTLASAPRAARVQELLELVCLRDAARAYPHELSGGQQQRVALARALAPRPSLLLLDEPFSSLDVQTRARLAADLRSLLKAAETTSLFVTHDQSEAFAMADRVGVMAQGDLLQWDRPDRLYRHPAHREVARFIGRGVLVPAAVLQAGGEGDVLLRPGDLRPDPAGHLRGVLTAVTFRGPHFEGRVQLPNGDCLDVDLGPATPPAVGSTLVMTWQDAAPIRFPA